jgi:hypothetical protein
MACKWVREWIREGRQKVADRRRLVRHGTLATRVGTLPSGASLASQSVPLHFLSQPAQALGAFKLEAAGQRLRACAVP